MDRFGEHPKKSVYFGKVDHLRDSNLSVALGATYFSVPFTSLPLDRVLTLVY